MLRLTEILLAPLLLLIAWEMTARLADIDPIFLPPPSTIARSAHDLAVSGEIGGHILASLQRVLIGYSIAALLGIAFGVILGWWHRASRFIDPLVELFRPVSPISIIPLAILWFGIGERSKVFLIAFATFFPVLLSTIAGVRSANPLLIRAASALGASQLRLVMTVAIPSAVPFIYNSLRLSMGVAMIVIISSEMVAADKGVGWFILDSERVYKTDYMFVGIITISLMSLLIDYALRVLRGILIPWWKETLSP